MKIFSFKRALGLAAITGAVMYVRKHGGIKNALDELMRTMDELLRVPNQANREAGSEARAAGERERTGYVGDYSRH